jgi:hypothetical protein
MKWLQDISRFWLSFFRFPEKPTDAAIYQLGPFGTAARELKEWELQH